MKGTTPPARPAGCLSDLRIDRWLADDLDAAGAEGARAHVAGCPDCAARVQRIGAARAASAAEAGAGLAAIRAAAAEATSGASSSLVRWRLWAPLAAGLGAAVAALVLGLRPPLDDGVRSKGGPRVGFFVKHGDRVRRGGPDEKVSPGDFVRFIASTAAPRYLAILGTDATRKATVYFPPDGPVARFPAGVELELPRSTLLDDALGPETLFALFCQERIDLEAARRALEARPEAPPSPPGCEVDRITWTKVSAR